MRATVRVRRHLTVFGALTLVLLGWGHRLDAYAVLTGGGSGPDGAFTGLDALRAWQADARPVPVTLDLAAKTATSEGAAALLVDFAGPHPLVIDGAVLDQLAAGHRLVETEPDVFGWAVVAGERNSAAG